MGSTLFFANGVVGTAQSPSPTLIVGAQFIEPDDSGFDKNTVEKPLTGSRARPRARQKLWVRDDPEYLF